MSVELPDGEGLERARAVRVQAIFRVTDEQHGQTVAARMVDSAHQIANLPECECDVDVSVEMASIDGSPTPAGQVGAPPRGRASNS